MGPGCAGALFSEDLVGPFDQLSEDDRSGEGRVLAGEVAFVDPTGLGAGSSYVQWDAVRDRVRECLSEWRPADRDDCVCDLVAHDVDRFSKQEDLDVVVELSECVRVEEREACLGRVVGTPRALQKDPAHRRQL